MLDLLSAPSTVPGLEVRIAVALAFTAAAAYYDMFNKKWVPNWLVYSFLVAALALNIIFFNQSVFAQGLLFGALVFIISYPLYRMGQLGGADAYVLTTIALAVPYLPSSLLGGAQSIPYPFILSLLAPTGLFFILHMLARFVPYISGQIAKKKLRLSFNDMAGGLMVLAAFIVFMYFLTRLPVSLPASYFAVVSFLIIALLFFSLFKSQIKDSMIEQVPVSGLQEEDVLALEKMDKSLVAKLRLQPLLTSKSIALLKKSKLKKLPVYTGMPFFLPYLFLGLLITVLFGDLLARLIQMSF